MFDFANFTLIILSIVIAMGRVTGFFLLLSPMSDTMIPGLCRRAIIVSFSVIVAPMVFKQLTPAMNPFFLVFMALKEVLIGAMLGFFANFPFYLAECIGNLIDNQRGSTMSEVYSPLSGAQVSTTGILFTQIFLAKTQSHSIEEDLAAKNSAHSEAIQKRDLARELKLQLEQLEW